MNKTFVKLTKYNEKTNGTEVYWIEADLKSIQKLQDYINELFLDEILEIDEDEIEENDVILYCKSHNINYENIIEGTINNNLEPDDIQEIIYYGSITDLFN